MDAESVLILRLAAGPVCYIGTRPKAADDRSAAQKPQASDFVDLRTRTESVIGGHWRALSCPRGRLQSPELKTRKLDGLFDLRSGKSVWGMFIGLDQTRRGPRSMALWQFASRWVTGKCAQIATSFRSEHEDEHNDAFRKGGSQDRSCARLPSGGRSSGANRYRNSDIET